MRILLTHTLKQWDNLTTQKGSIQSIQLVLREVPRGVFKGFRKHLL